MLFHLLSVKKKSFEIDDEIDFEIVKTLIKNKKL